MAGTQKHVIFNVLSRLLLHHCVLILSDLAQHPTSSLLSLVAGFLQ